MKKDVLLAVTFFLLLIAFFVWVIVNPPSFNDWWDAENGCLPSFP